LSGKVDPDPAFVSGQQSAKATTSCKSFFLSILQQAASPYEDWETKVGQSCRSAVSFGVALVDKILTAKAAQQRRPTIGRF
jgi:hypothetical protein